MNNQIERKSFIIHKDSLSVLNKLSDEQAGKLFKAIFDYHVKDILPTDNLLSIIFEPFFNQFKRDAEKYANTCEARKVSGSKGGKSFYLKDSGVDNFGRTQFYVLRLFNDDESFIKIGITSSKLNRRFAGPKNMPYNYEIISQIVNDEMALKLESYFTDKLLDYRYEPLITFPGHMECYSYQSLPLIIEDDIFAQAKQSKTKQNKANLADSDSKSDSDSKNNNGKPKGFIKPNLEEIFAYCQERKNSVNPQGFLDHYISNGWKVGKNPMKDWKATVRKWERSSFESNQTKINSLAEKLNQIAGGQYFQLANLETGEITCVAGMKTKAFSLSEEIRNKIKAQFNQPITIK